MQRKHSLRVEGDKRVVIICEALNHAGYVGQQHCFYHHCPSAHNNSEWWCRNAELGKFADILQFNGRSNLACGLTIQDNFDRYLQCTHVHAVRLRLELLTRSHGGVSAMEAYPEHYIAHNLPLILLSGIGHAENAGLESPERSRNLLQEGGFRIRTDIPPLTDPTSENLLRTFLSFDSAIHANTKDVSTRDKAGAFKIKTVGRVG
jgi:hypothetical protein